MTTEADGTTRPIVDSSFVIPLDNRHWAFVIQAAAVRLAGLYYFGPVGGLLLALGSAERYHVSRRTLSARRRT